MIENASQAIASDKPYLLEKIEQNTDIANVLIAMLGKLVISYRTAGQIKMAPIQVIDNEFRSRVEVVGTPLSLPPQLVMHNDLRDYMTAKNIALARVLTLNKPIADFFQELVMRLVAYADFHHIAFKDLRVVQGSAFISKDNKFVIKVGRESVIDLTPFNKLR